MKTVYIAADNIISSLGLTTAENMAEVLNGNIGLRTISDNRLLPVNICTSLTDKSLIAKQISALGISEPLTYFEQLLLLSVNDAVKHTTIDLKSQRTLFIISTTKGSIDVFENPQFGKDRLFLWKSASIVNNYFQNPNKPLVISNACISGVLAVIKASALIASGAYDHVVVTGADLVTSFVASGFQAFKALSDEPCRPFDKDRKGLNLGEAAGTIILTSNKEAINNPHPIAIGRGCTANDATHISAPSRQAQGLVRVISAIFQQNSNFSINAVDFISAHGTATVYNDEMEAVALHKTGLSHVPVNSFKGYWGHTLGAAGIIETIATAYSMTNNVIIQSAGFDIHGTTDTLNIITENRKAELNVCLKLASGFGGCNAGVLLYRT